MRLDPILTRAVRFLMRKKYGDVISILQPEVVRYHDSFNYHYILGSACLRAGDLGGAFTYFKRAREIKMLDPSVLLGMAVCYLHRGDTGKAVDLYLEVLDVESRNRIAKKALQVLRKNSGPDGIQNWIDSGKALQLFPPAPKLPLTAERILLPAIGVLLALALAGGILVKLGVIPLGKTVSSERGGLAGLALEREDRETPVQTGGTFRYILTRNQVLEIYEAARKLFMEYRDEAAKVSLNRLIESNASDPVKNKARLIISYMEVPGFDTLKDRFPYAEVKQDPLLYRDCYIIWRGMATNLKEDQDSTSFDFLVGYDTRSTLEGIVQVVFDFSVPVNLERPLEVLAKVIPISSAAGEDGIRLEGIALHQAAFLGK
ncbi:tetratricopeptide repeat protein [Treponema primitia]|uniref:tetratricopeptide repeat protein n=1 Tax=Treponema primitia TaxID=88058 RepID=UPI003980F8D5